MTKNRKIKSINKPVVWLFITAIAIELINYIYSVAMGNLQMNTCPRDPLPAQIAAGLTIVSALVALAAVIPAKKPKLLVSSLALFHILVIGVLLQLLQFYASGGLNWCDYHF